MRKMKITKTLIENRINYATCTVNNDVVAAEEGTLTIYTGGPITEEKAQKILHKEKPAAVFIDHIVNKISYEIDAEEFAALAKETTREVVNA